MLSKPVEVKDILLLVKYFYTKTFKHKFQLTIIIIVLL